MRWDTGRGWEHDHDDSDLYPPDLEIVTPEASNARNRAAVGTFLVTIGTGLVLERIVGRDLDLFLLGVGFALIAAWLQAPRFWLFAAGAIVSGIAIGDFLESLVSLPFETTLGSLCSAAGFFAVFVRYPQRAKWAVIPAVVILAFGALAGAIEVIGLVPAMLGSLGVPTLLILGGGVLLVRNTLPAPVVKGGLVVIGILLLTSMVSTVDSWDGSRIGDDRDPRAVDPSGDRPPYDVTAPVAELPDLNGRTLVVETASGSIDLSTVSVGRGEVRTTDGPVDPTSSIEVQETSDTVTVAWRSGAAGAQELPDALGWVVEVPEGSRVVARTDDGAIFGDLEDGTFLLESSEGPIDVTVDDDATVVAESDESPVTVDGREEGTQFRTGSAADDASVVTIKTDEGPISITGLRRAA